MDYSSSSSLPYVEEKTEVIYGDENIIDSTLKLFSVARLTLNNCLDSTGPSMDVIPGHPITRAHYEMKERGVKIRYITEITKENVNYCKELMNFSEVRHLDEVKGNFGVLDGIYYRASAKLETSSHRLCLYRVLCAHLWNNKNTFLICYGRRQSLPNRELKKLKKI